MMRRLASLLALVVVCALTVGERALAEESYPTVAGVWLSQETGRRCTSECQQQILASLRRITGLQQLRFSRAGALELGDREAVAGGSTTARRLLFQALENGDVFLVEAHPNSPEVTFGQLSEGLIYEVVGSRQRLTVWRLRLDLADFKRIEAPAQVLAAFDVGVAFLHELLHGLGYEDPEDFNQLGECEELLNQARAELGLPLREQYFGQALQITPQIITVRLAFRDAPKAALPGGKRPKRRSYHLFFLPELESHPRIIEELSTQNYLRRRR